MGEPKTVYLSNGVELPLIGLGTSLTDSSERDKLYNAVQTAVDAGYRHFDTATVYNTETIIGQALKDCIAAGKIKRSDLFLTTKLPSYANEANATGKLLERSLSNLQTDYIDLYLIHSPMSAVPNENLDGNLDDEYGRVIPDKSANLVETWKVLEAAYKQGKVRSIGLSNFNTKQVQKICDSALVQPHCLQIELHIYLKEQKLVDLCRQLQIQLIGYGTLGSPGRSIAKPEMPSIDCLNHPITQELAQKYGKTPAQILLRQQIQNGIACIPKSVTTHRIWENIRIFDFVLSKKDFQRFDTEITKEVRVFPGTKFKHHPEYPF